MKQTEIQERDHKQLGKKKITLWLLFLDKKLRKVTMYTLAHVTLEITFFFFAGFVTAMGIYVNRNVEIQTWSDPKAIPLLFLIITCILIMALFFVEKYYKKLVKAEIRKNNEYYEENYYGDLVD